MNSENFDIEQMRKAWAEMGKALGMQVIPENNPQILDRKRTSLDRLRDRYMAFWIIGLLMAFAGFFMFFFGGIVADERFKLWLGIAYAVYFLTAASLDFWLWRGVTSIDPLQMSVAEISCKSMLYRKRHLQFMAVLIPMAIALLGFTAYVFSSDKFFVSGMTAGIIGGAIIGIFQFRKFMNEYRNLSV